jgi:hypothetical protein
MRDKKESGLEMNKERER